jgi:coniferyl-aldehyde dehydrogenase
MKTLDIEASSVLATARSTTSGGPAASTDGDAHDIRRMRELLTRQRQAFAANPFPSVQQRKNNLTKLIDLLQRNQDDIAVAINADFGVRAGAESKLVDVMGPILEARHIRSHLGRWMKPRRRSTELLFITNRAWVEYQPKGVVGIIGTWNIPLYLTLGPLAAALGAGNRAIIKTSEFAPRTAQLLRRMLAEAFSEDEVAVCTGGVDAAQAFNAQPFDHLVFTGSSRVGREVMRAAAQNLTPVTLELGGKSPALVGTANLQDAALRIAHGKVFNSGQICVSPDYALVPKGQSQAFVEAVRASFVRLAPSVNGNPEYTSVINDRHAARLRDLLEEAQARGARLWPCAGDVGSGRQIPLTLVTQVTDEMRLMQEEIFGPVLPVMEYDSLDDALRYIRAHERPLALYAFGFSAAEEAYVLQQTHSGGVSINDWGWHVFQHDLPFGGIGNAGMGSYHGEEGFRELSHGKSVFKRHRWFPVHWFYPPYGNLVQRLAMRLYLGKSH